MAHMRNVPNQVTVLQIAARKSFSLAVYFRNPHNEPITIENSTVRFTLARATDNPAASDTLVSIGAAEVLPSAGAIRFDLQASDLDLPTGEYPFEITVESQGYSAIVLRGVVELEPSYDYESTRSSYSDPAATGTLRAILDKNSIRVETDGTSIRGAQGVPGPAGEPGDPYENVLLEYDSEGRISMLTQGSRTTYYTYNTDGTIATDSRDSITRTYIYSGGNLVSIVSESQV